MSTPRRGKSLRSCSADEFHCGSGFFKRLRYVVLVESWPSAIRVLSIAATLTAAWVPAEAAAWAVEAELAPAAAPAAISTASAASAQAELLRSDIRR